MARWCTLTSLLMVSLGLPGAAVAQMYETAGPGAAPAGWNQAGYVSTGEKTKVRSYGPMGPLPTGPGRSIYEELPDDQGWLYDEMPLDRILKNTFRHAYFRTDYLLWNVSEPGNNLVGSDTDIVGLAEVTPNDPSDPLYPESTTAPFLFQPFVDPLIPFQVSNPATNNQSYIAVVQPTLNEVRINQNNGIRTTFGLPTFANGTFEASVFALQTSTNTLFRAPVRQYDVYDSDGDGVFGEPHGGLPTGEFDRDGDGDITEVVNDFQAFAIPILVDGVVPSPIRNYIDGGVEDGRLADPSNPLSPGTELDPRTANPNDTRPIANRGDNFRIVWAVGDPTDPTRFISTYNAVLRTSIWGSEANFLTDTWDPGSQVSVRPILGFRYVEFRENFSQTGNYQYAETDPRNPANTLTTISPRSILSSSINNLYGPQLGLRAELPSRWFTLGVQPKVMMGLNTYKATLDTQNVLRPDGLLVAAQNTNNAVDRAALQALLRPDDVDQSLRENQSTFGVVGDLEVFSQLHLTEHLSLHVGYNLMWVGMITRPYDNIIYNATTVPIDNGDGTVTNRLDTDFKLNVDYSGAILQGLNIGGEVRY